MRRKMLSVGIALFMIVTAILFFSSPVMAAGEEDITFLGQNGEVRTGRRCGTLPPTAEQIEAVQRNIMNRAIAAIPCTVTIPVAFHILRHNDGVTGDISDVDINAQLDVLNAAYASTNFQFELHSIERVNNTTWAGMNTTSAETAAKQALAVDPAHTLNIYTCTGCQGYLGWSYFPDWYPENSYMHGIVVLYSSFPSGISYPYDEGDTVTHEAGHYLGLYHTFQGGCSAPGDQIDDTPYEASAAYGCPESRDTCPAAGLDPIHNFMDYTDDACMDHFTAGQSDRIDSMIEIYKPSLITCTDTSIPGILFDDAGFVWISINEMGTLMGNTWEIVAKTDYPGFTNIGIGMRFNNPAWDNEFGMIIFADDNWYAHGCYGNWVGEGTPCYYSVSTGAQGIWILSTSPPLREAASSVSALTLR